MTPTVESADYSVRESTMEENAESFLRQKCKARIAAVTGRVRRACHVTPDPSYGYKGGRERKRRAKIIKWDGMENREQTTTPSKKRTLATTKLCF